MQPVGSELSPKGEDGKQPADCEAPAGMVRLVKQETMAEEEPGDVASRGRDAAVQDAPPGGAGSARSSQRADKGIVEMRRMVNRLVRRLHYSAFSCPAKDTWVNYHRTVDRSATASEVAERLVWAVRQLLPGMLRAAWLSRREQWESRCLSCRDKNSLRLLKFELEKYAISWEAVEASTTSDFSTAVKSKDKEKIPASGEKRGRFPAEQGPAKDSGKGKAGLGERQGRPSCNTDTVNASKDRADRYKRRRCHPSDGDVGTVGGRGDEQAAVGAGPFSRRDAQQSVAEIVQGVLEHRPEAADFALSAGGRSESESGKCVQQEP